MAATLDALSGGRLIFFYDCGWQEAEVRAVAAQSGPLSCLLWGARYSRLFTQLGEIMGVPTGCEQAYWSPSQRVTGFILANGTKTEFSPIAFTPDGRRLVCSGSRIDGEHPIQVWELPVRWPGKLLRGHTLPIRCLAISPDSAVVAAGGDDGTVRLWRLPGGAPMAELRLGSSVSSLAISPQGTLLAAAGAEGFIQVWRLPGGERLATLYAQRSLTSLVISPDGRLLISGPPDHAVRVWRLPDGASLATLEGHAGPIKSLAISPDGRVVISGSADGTVRLWTSELVRLSHVPLPMTTHDDLNWVETALRDGAPSKAERSWLEVLLGLMRWRRLFDIVVEESAAEPARPGPFDILIED